MGKDPAFLFYPNDYLGGTMGWTFEEKGAYIELLMMQFNRGHMTKHMIGQTVGQLWDNIQCKFQKDEKGLYYNSRLELEQNKRKAFTASRRNNLSGKNQFSDGGHMRGHVTDHMENRNIDENAVSKAKPKRGSRILNNIYIIPTVEEIQKYCSERKNKINPSKFFDFYQSKGWMVGKNKMKDWKASVRLWERRDNEVIESQPANKRGAEPWKPDFDIPTEEERDEVAKMVNTTAKGMK